MTAQHAWFEKLSPEMQKHLKENPGELSEEAAEAVERAGRPVGHATAEGHNPKYHLDHDEWVWISQHPHA